jgi:hypothetical protein
MLFNPLAMPETKAPTPDGLAEAGRLIAGGDPPDWLLAALAQWGRVVGGDRVTGEDAKQIAEAISQAQRNIAQLLRFLQKFLPDLTALADENIAIDILLALEVLPRIAAAIPQPPAEPRRDGGQRSDKRTRICPGLVVDGWRIIRGTEPAVSGKEVGEGCQTYWEACGHDNVRDWGREIEEAIAEGGMRKFLERRGKFATSPPR